MVGQGRRRRQRVFNRRKLADFLRRPRPIRVVQVVSEEVLVILIVPGIALARRVVGVRLVLFLRLRLGGLEIFGRHFLEHRVLDHFLVEQVRQLKGRHRQQLDGLLQRGGQNQLLNEFGVKPLLDTHWAVLCRLSPDYGAG